MSTMELDKPSSSKVQRIASQTKGLVEDVKSWVDLKVSLAQIDIEDKVNVRLNSAIVNGAVAILALGVVFFLLVAAALALGAWLDNTVYGFLLVAAALLILLLLVLAVRPSLIDITIRRSKNQK